MSVILIRGDLGLWFLFGSRMLQSMGHFNCQHWLIQPFLSQIKIIFSYYIHIFILLLHQKLGLSALFSKDSWLSAASSAWDLIQYGDHNSQPTSAKISTSIGHFNNNKVLQQQIVALCEHWAWLTTTSWPAYWMRRMWYPGAYTWQQTTVGQTFQPSKKEGLAEAWCP